MAFGQFQYPPVPDVTISRPRTPPRGRRPRHRPAGRPPRPAGAAHRPKPARLRTRPPRHRRGRHPLRHLPRALQRRRRRPRLPAALLRFRCLGCDHFSTDVSFPPRPPGPPRRPAAQPRTAHVRLRSRRLGPHSGQALPGRNPPGAPPHRPRPERPGRPHPEDRAHIEQAVTLVRRSRTVMLGMPRVRQPLPDARPTRKLT